jgi:cobalt/nickel transport protein
MPFAFTVKGDQGLMRIGRIFIITVATSLMLAAVSPAHFGMIIPSTDIVGKDDPREISLILQFTHPFEGRPQMDLVKPEKFGVIVEGKVTDLTGILSEKKVGGASVWETKYKITRPADYIFFMQPKPYWEPAEDKFIIHFTKVIVDALGAQTGWDNAIAEPAGIPVEIVPISRPYGLYAGNLFTGRVLRDGKPVANSEVEVEFWGKGRIKAPTDSHVRQVIKTDSNGVFSYAMPKSGWWGFSAIMEGPESIKYEGKDKKVEIGAVIWVQAYPMQ